MTMLVLGIVLAAMPAVALGGDARHASNRKSFPDSIGEDPQAPDVTDVTVSNDDTGLITFQINVSNRSALTPDMYFLIDLDTDRKASTGGDGVGADYAIDLTPGEVDLFKWTGTDFVYASAQQSSLTFSYTATGPVIKISAADLNKTKAFDFDVAAVSGVTKDAAGDFDFSNSHEDDAPDDGHGLYSYPVLTKLVLTVTAFTMAPKPARAGNPFTVSMAAIENDTGDLVRAGTVGCAASDAGKHLVAVTHVVRNEAAICVWRIPATAKGRIVHGLISLTVRGTSVTRRFSARIA